MGTEKIKKQKVLLLTATGAYNLGDEVIFREEVKFLKSRYGEQIDIFACTYDQKSAIFEDSNIHFLSYFPNDLWGNFLGNIKFFFQNIYTLITSHVVIVGGGGLIFDNEPGVSFQKLFSQWTFRVSLARIFGAKIIFLGMSLEVKSAKNRMMLGKLFKGKDTIILRDERSVGILEALGIPSRHLPDLAFLTEPIIQDHSNYGKKRIGISVRGGFLGENEQYIPQIYDYLESHDYEPVFLIHTSDGDEAQNDILYIHRLMKGKRYAITHSITQTLSVYPTLHAVIGMRFHSGVFACTHHIPFLMISYGPKTDELIKLLEFDEFIIRPEALNMERFIHLWERLESEYPERAELMRQKHEQIRNHLITSLSHF